MHYFTEPRSHGATEPRSHGATEPRNSCGVRIRVDAVCAEPSCRRATI
ncbi:hypothetical protein HMPREF1155_0950 [Slackia sp. CM382]|nr:hypothetical protein HMPREF1155_0950 [Slackia sp. CM382]